MMKYWKLETLNGSSSVTLFTCTSEKTVQRDERARGTGRSFLEASEDLLRFVPGGPQEPQSIIAEAALKEFANQKNYKPVSLICEVEEIPQGLDFEEMAVNSSHATLIIYIQRHP